MKYLFVILIFCLVGCASTTVSPAYSVRSPGCDRFATFKGVDFQPIDKINMDSSAKRCRFMKPNSPCIVKFEKLAHMEYYVECGRDF